MASAVKSSLWRNLPFNLRGLCSLWVVSKLNCRASYNHRTVDIRELFKHRVNVCECVHKCINVGMNVCVWVDKRGTRGLWAELDSGLPSWSSEGQGMGRMPSRSQGCPWEGRQQSWILNAEPRQELRLVLLTA